MANIYGLNNTSFPENIQVFKQFQDLSSTDSANYFAYLNALAKPDTAEAKKYLNLIGENKLVTALDFNQICDTVLACEKFYEGEDNATKQFWQNVLNQFAYVQNWKSGTTYNKFNIVAYQNYLYIALVNNPSGVPSSTPNQWAKISVGNIAGTTTTWRGVYDTANTYYVGDMVSFDNVWYIATLDNPTSAPPSDDWEKYIDFNLYNPIISRTRPINQIVGTLWYEVI